MLSRLWATCTSSSTALLGAYDCRGHLDEASQIFGPVPVIITTAAVSMVRVSTIFPRESREVLSSMGRRKMDLKLRKAMLVAYAQFGHEHGLSFFERLREGRSTLSRRLMRRGASKSTMEVCRPTAADEQRGSHTAIIRSRCSEDIPSLYGIFCQRLIHSRGAMMAAAGGCALQPAGWNWRSQSSQRSVFVTATSRRSASREVLLSYSRLYSSKEFEERKAHVEFICELIGNADPSTDLKTALDGNAQVVDTDFVVAVLKRSSTAKRALEFFDWAGNQPGFRHELQTYNHLLDVLVKSGELSSTQGVLQAMLDEGCVPNLVSFNILVRGYTKAGDLQQAMVLFHGLKKYGLEPDVWMLNFMLQGFFKQGNVADGLKLFQEVDENLPDIFSYNIVVNGLCRSGKVGQAWEVMETMKARGLAPDTVTYNTLISSLYKANRMSDARRVFQEMSEAGVQPDVLTCNILVSVACKDGNLDEAYRILDTMERWEGLSPNSVTYNTLIDGLCKAGRVVEACQVVSWLSTQKDKAVRPNVVTYNTLVDGLCKSRMLVDALTLVADMPAQKVLPDSVTYTALINGLCRGGELKSALKLLLGTLEKGYTPDAITYTSLVEGLCKGGDMEGADQLVSEMETRGHETGSVVLSCLISGYCRTGNLVRAAEVLSKSVKARGSVPSWVSCDLVLQRMQKARMWDEASELLSRLVDVGYEPPRNAGSLATR